MKANLFFILLVSILYNSQALANIKSLIDESKEFYKIIVAEEKEEAKRKDRAAKGYRPNSCPIFSDQYSEFYLKMQKVMTLLKNDKDCVKQIGGTIENIQNDLGELNKFQLDQEKVIEKRKGLLDASEGKESETLTPEQRASKDLQHFDRQNQLSIIRSSLGNLNGLAALGVCRKSLTSSEIMGLLSDVVVGGTTYGMMIPSNIGTGVALAGMAVFVIANGAGAWSIHPLPADDADLI